MNISSKIAHMAETVKGAAKRMADRRNLRTEGQVNHSKGDIEQTGTKFKDASGN